MPDTPPLTITLTFQSVADAHLVASAIRAYQGNARLSDDEYEALGAVRETINRWAKVITIPVTEAEAEAVREAVGRMPR